MTRNHTATGASMPPGSERRLDQPDDAGGGRPVAATLARQV